MKNQNIVILEGVEKQYPILGGVFKRQIGSIRVLNGIDLCLKRGEITGLVGESGCGKSTLARLLMKLELPTAGRILFADQAISQFRGKQKKKFYRQVQMVFQDPFSSLNPRMKVKQIIGEMARIQGDSRQEAEARVISMLDAVELDRNSLDRFPHEFSGGQRQRIAIARALIIKPQLLIADEPVSALDLSLQTKTLALLTSLKETLNLTIFLISHDLRKVASFCQTVAVMYLGRIVEIIPANRLLSDCRHPYTQALITSIPVSDPRKRAARKKVLKGEVPSPINLPAGCAFHQRCEKRLPHCDKAVPELKQVDHPSHRLACFLMDR